jgi:hypothetical protein
VLLVRLAATTSMCLYLLAAMLLQLFTAMWLYLLAAMG